jgi:hypothetical protein
VFADLGCFGQGRIILRVIKEHFLLLTFEGYGQHLGGIGVGLLGKVVCPKIVSENHFVFKGHSSFVFTVLSYILYKER